MVVKKEIEKRKQNDKHLDVKSSRKSDWSDLMGGEDATIEGEKRYNLQILLSFLEWLLYRQ